MFKVKVIKNGAIKFGSTFTTKVEAESWVESQEAKGSWGKKEVIMVVAEVQPPMKLIEEVKGPMGVKAFKVKLPADYEVIIEHIDPDLYDRDNKIKQLIEKRDQLLCATDYLFISDVKVDQKHRRIYMEYRQYLRELPSKLNKVGELYFESFADRLKRLNPEEFMDGGKQEEIIRKFMYYVK